METENQPVETTTTKENSDAKVNLALTLGVLGTLLSIVAIVMTMQTPKAPVVQTPDTFFAAEAKAAGIKGKTFEQCLADPQTQGKVDEDQAEVLALTNGQAGTPYSVVMMPNGGMVPVSGALPLDVFQVVIDLGQEGQFDAIQDIYNQVYGGEENAPQVNELEGKTLRPFDPATDHYKGNPNAEIAVIEYSDYECPFCSRVHPTLEQLVAANPDIAWVYRHHPLSFHPQAAPAARAAECIAEYAGNEAFWSFTDLLFEDQSLLQN